jgi:thiol-disulfide isomerase/thioredoxin
MSNFLFKAARLVYLLCLLTGFCMKLSAQDSLTRALGRIAVTHDGPGLSVGETVPFVRLKTVNSIDPPKQLSDLKGRLVILDFWHQYCSSCLAQFPHLEVLQKQFADSLVILPVTFQSEISIKEFMEKRKLKGMPINLPSVVEDTVLRKHFPHEGDPFEVWINAAGKVIGSTNRLGVSDSIIRSVLKGNKKILESFNISDEAADRVLSANESDAASQDGPVSYVQLTHYNPHIRQHREFAADSGTSRFVHVNQSVISLFKMLTGPEESRELYQLFKYTRDNYDKRVIRRGARSRALKDYPDIDLKDFNQSSDFVKNYLYCTNIVLPAGNTYREANQLLHNNLETIFKVRTSVQKLKIPCLALIKLHSPGVRKVERPLLNVEVSDEDSATLSDISVAGLVGILNANLRIPFVVDQTNYKGLFNIRLHLVADEPLENIRATLRQYGFDLKKVTRTMDMLVIQDK